MYTQRNGKTLIDLNGKNKSEINITGLIKSSGQLVVIKKGRKGAAKEVRKGSEGNM